MNSTHQIEKCWIKAFSYEPTIGQLELIQKLSGFIADDAQHKLFVLKGYAGTGKTSIVSTLVNILPQFKLKSVLLAPTGRAAKVLSGYSGMSAYTIHKKIYFLGMTHEGYPTLLLKKNQHKNTVFIIDEASMIPETNSSANPTFWDSRGLLEDLINYVFEGENCSMILIGDTTQLPPVSTSLSPALDIEYISKSYFVNPQHYELTDVVRQQHESGILKSATKLRNHIRSGNIDPPFFQTGNHRDFLKISGSELEDALLDAYSKYGEENTVILCRSNKRANIFNQEIRNRILFRENEINGGDSLMVVRNNYFWTENIPELEFIANGDLIEIKRISRIEEIEGFNFADISFRFIDYPDHPDMEVKILLDTIKNNYASLPIEEIRKLSQIPLTGLGDASSKKKREIIMKDPFYNALQVKFAYAITTHKSQGGQWEAVFIDQGYLTSEMINLEYLRWLYTAITRATKVVYLVNFNEILFSS